MGSGLAHSTHSPEQLDSYLIDRRTVSDQGAHMADKGKDKKGERENRKKAQLTPKEKRAAKRAKKN